MPKQFLSHYQFSFYRKASDITCWLQKNPKTQQSKSRSLPTSTTAYSRHVKTTQLLEPALRPPPLCVSDAGPGFQGTSSRRRSGSVPASCGASAAALARRWVLSTEGCSPSPAAPEGGPGASGEAVPQEWKASVNEALPLFTTIHI